MSTKERFVVQDIPAISKFRSSTSKGMTATRCAVGSSRPFGRPELLSLVFTESHQAGPWASTRFPLFPRNSWLLLSCRYLFLLKSKMDLPHFTLLIRSPFNMSRESFLFFSLFSNFDHGINRRKLWDCFLTASIEETKTSNAVHTRWSHQLGEEHFQPACRTGLEFVAGNEAPST